MDIFNYYWDLLSKGDYPIELTIERLAQLITIQFTELKRAPRVRMLLRRRSKIHIYVQVYFIIGSDGTTIRIGSEPLDKMSDNVFGKPMSYCFTHSVRNIIEKNYVLVSNDIMNHIISYNKSELSPQSKVQLVTMRHAFSDIK